MSNNKKRTSNILLVVVALIPWWTVSLGQKSDTDEFVVLSSGSGFAVTGVGHVVTNNHVVADCAQVDIHYQGRAIRASIIYRDEKNDLALIKGSFAPNEVFPISRDEPRILQEIYVAGFPFGDRISSSIKVTKGIVSSLVGLGNNSANIQIDAALQPGNSGGPIFDSKGNVVAVAVAKLDLLNIVKNWGVIPEDTNFGIKSTVLVELLDRNEITIKESNITPLSNVELGKLLNGATYLLSCSVTSAQFERFREKSKPESDDVPQSSDEFILSGIYSSQIIGTNRYIAPREQKNKPVNIEQDGNQVSGRIGSDGTTFKGTIDGTTITFEWYSSFTYGRGSFEIRPESNTLLGKWVSTEYDAQGEWILRKMQ